MNGISTFFAEIAHGLQVTGWNRPGLRDRKQLSCHHAEPLELAELTFAIKRITGSDSVYSC